MIRDAQELLTQLKAIQAAIRNEIVAECERSSIEQLSQVAAEDAAGDTIFSIDRVSEEILLTLFEKLAQRWSFVLVAEGLGADGVKILPEGIDPTEAELYIIVDPIDGTRGLMYQKRPAWILTGVAPNCGPTTGLADIELALQTEIPLIKQHLSDTLWAIAGHGAQAERYNRLTDETQSLRLTPSRATTIEQGYGGLSRFFPGVRGLLANIDDEIVKRTLGPVVPGRAQAFEDQYICTGGQLYELMMGHDRWQADLRPLADQLPLVNGHRQILCCHPYDMCTGLVAQEAGVIITDPAGQPLNIPLDAFSEVAWLGYANPAIEQQIAPVLRQVLQEYNLLNTEANSTERG